MTRGYIKAKQAVLILALAIAGYSGIKAAVEMQFKKDPNLMRFMSRLLMVDDERLAVFAQARRREAGKGGSAAAVEFSQEALRRNPASPQQWCDLGFALLDSGRKEEARYCIERALRLGPNLNPIQWYAGQFYFRIGEKRSALRCSARILELSHSDRDGILDFYAAGNYKLEDTLNYGLPPDPAIGRAYFRALLRTREAEPVGQAWNWLAARSIPDVPLTNAYVDYLMTGGLYDEAVAVWLARLGETGTYWKSDFLYNGGFESAPCGSVFDWRVTPVNGVEAERDSNIFHSGKWSLRIEFGGDANLNYRNVPQETVLNPGRYTFQAYVRTEDISTDKGIGFQIYDPGSPARLSMRTGQLIGTNDWTELHLDVKVSVGTRRVRVEVVRDVSERFDNKIKGTVWIDDIRITRVE